MPYDEFMADRICQYMDNHKVNYFTKKMFGGLCFMVEEKMCCALVYSKKRNTEFLMARAGEEVMNEALQKEGAHGSEFVGRQMKGYVHITPEGYDTDEDLEYWLSLCLAYNPHAKASKKSSKNK